MRINNLNQIKYWNEWGVDSNLNFIKGVLFVIGQVKSRFRVHTGLVSS